MQYIYPGINIIRAMGWRVQPLGWRYLNWNDNPCLAGMCVETLMSRLAFYFWTLIWYMWFEEMRKCVWAEATCVVWVPIIPCCSCCIVVVWSPEHWSLLALEGMETQYELKLNGVLHLSRLEVTAQGSYTSPVDQNLFWIQREGNTILRNTNKQESFHAPPFLSLSVKALVLKGKI